MSSAIQLTSRHGSLSIEPEGAHMTHWRCNDAEQLFVSSASRFEPGVAIRGGVPIVFPQFNQFGPGPKHGFARVTRWRQVPSEQADTLCLVLEQNPSTLSQWPHAFKAEFRASLTANSLSMQLSIVNQDDEPFAFTSALHTYFAVADIREAQLSGVSDTEYWDNGTPFEQRQSHPHDSLSFSGPIDRIYFNNSRPLILQDGARQRRVEQQGFADTVVWNPWREGAGALADMEDEEYRYMLCVEAANVQNPITLKPAESWQGQQRICLI